MEDNHPHALAATSGLREPDEGQHALGKAPLQPPADTEITAHGHWQHSRPKDQKVKGKRLMLGSHTATTNSAGT